ncbi:MAG TPA: hypothetical protein VD706_02095 [Candidatus Saccharimonadales bacterium]|nr:hypothetical protein [Candidatus Saccharimonadales bacterium]
MTEDRTLEERVAKLEARNRRVEADKAWETSWTRRLALTLFIYITVVFYLHFVIHINPWINGLVPVIGYFVSTLTVSFLKRRFTDRQREE